MSVPAPAGNQKAMDDGAGNITPLRPSRVITWPEALLLAGLVLLSVVCLVAGAYLSLFGVPAPDRYGVVLGKVVQPASAVAREAGSRFAAAAGSSVVIRSAGAGRHVVVTVRTDAGGLFRVQLPPGSYIVSAHSPQAQLSAGAQRIHLLGGQALNPRLQLSAPMRAADTSAPR